MAHPDIQFGYEREGVRSWGQEIFNLLQQPFFRDLFEPNKGGPESIWLPGSGPALCSLHDLLLLKREMSSSVP